MKRVGMKLGRVDLVASPSSFSAVGRTAALYMNILMPIPLVELSFLGGMDGLELAVCLSALSHSHLHSDQEKVCKTRVSKFK